MQRPIFTRPSAASSQIAARGRQPVQPDPALGVLRAPVVADHPAPAVDRDLRPSTAAVPEARGRRRRSSFVRGSGARYIHARGRWKRAPRAPSSATSHNIVTDPPGARSGRRGPPPLSASRRPRWPGRGAVSLAARGPAVGGEREPERALRCLAGPLVDRVAAHTRAAPPGGRAEVEALVVAGPRRHGGKRASVGSGCHGRSSLPPWPIADRRDGRRTRPRHHRRQHRHRRRHRTRAVEFGSTASCCPPLGGQAPGAGGRARRREHARAALRRDELRRPAGARQGGPRPFRPHRLVFANAGFGASAASSRRRSSTGSRWFGQRARRGATRSAPRSATSASRTTGTSSSPAPSPAGARSRFALLGHEAAVTAMARRYARSSRGYRHRA